MTTGDNFNYIDNFWGDYIHLQLVYAICSWYYHTYWCL